MEARANQLGARKKLLEEAHKKLWKTRNEGVKYWDDWCAHRLREPLKKGTLVLVYNKTLEDQWGKLFENRWNGPYRVVGQNPGGSYSLEELDGVLLKRRVAAAHVKRFFPRGKKD